ncbi:hypothetical protein, partial [Micromonospora sp. ATA51]|uniref:hypothetical protein n=1 Tax=Micromonospora sp. ATA51 TaxID=2806098 RepID=UPI001A3AACB4
MSQGSVGGGLGRRTGARTTRTTAAPAATRLRRASPSAEAAAAGSLPSSAEITAVGSPAIVSPARRRRRRRGVRVPSSAEASAGVPPSGVAA